MDLLDPRIEYNPMSIYQRILTASLTLIYLKQTHRLIISLKYIETWGPFVCPASIEPKPNTGIRACVLRSPSFWTHESDANDDCDPVSNKMRTSINCFWLFLIFARMVGNTVCFKTFNSREALLTRGPTTEGFWVPEDCLSFEADNDGDWIVVEATDPDVELFVGSSWWTK